MAGCWANRWWIVHYHVWIPEGKIPHGKSHQIPWKVPWKSHEVPMTSQELSIIQNKYRSPGAAPECTHLGQWPSRRRLCWNPLDSMTRLSIQDYSCQHYIYYHIFISIHVYIILYYIYIWCIYWNYIYACACTYVCIYTYIATSTKDAVW